jgi:hypothetical protein
MRESFTNEGGASFPELADDSIVLQRRAYHGAP